MKTWEVRNAERSKLEPNFPKNPNNSLHMKYDE